MNKGGSGSFRVNARDGRRVFMDAIAQLILCLAWLAYRVFLQLLTGDSAIGYWSFACDVLVIFVLVTSGGFSQAVSRITFQAHNRHDAVNEYGILRYAMITSAVFGAVSAILLYLLAPQICLLLFGETVQTAAASLRVMAPAVFCMSISGSLRGYYYGVGTVMPGRTSQFLFVFVSFLGSILSFSLINSEDAVFLAGAGSFGILFGSIASMLLLLVIHMMIRPRILRSARKDMLHIENTYSVFLKTFLAGFKPFIATTCGIVILLLGDAAVYSCLTGLRGYDVQLITSLYGIYTGKYMLILCIPLVILISKFPKMVSEISGSYLHGETMTLSILMQRCMRYGMLIAIPAGVTAAVTPDAFCGLVFGDVSVLTGKMLFAGAPLIIFASYAAAVCMMLAGIDRLKRVLVNGIIAFVLHMIFLVILLYYSDMNIYAVLYSDTIFAFTICALGTLALLKYAPYRQEYMRAYVIPAAASAVMGAVQFLIWHGLSQAEIPFRAAALISVLFSVFIYTAALILFRGITQEEMRQYPLGKAFAAIAVRLHLF